MAAIDVAVRSSPARVQLAVRRRVGVRERPLTVEEPMDVTMERRSVQRP